jgi:hypothetical protein
VDLTGRLDVFRKRKICCCCRELHDDSSVVTDKAWAIFSYVACPAVQYFSIYSHKRYDFLKSIYGTLNI